MSDLHEALLAHPGEDIVHVRYAYGYGLSKAGWQAATYWCSLGGTALAERANCPVRPRKAQAMADAKALGLPIR